MRNNNSLLNRRLPRFAGLFVMLIAIAVTVTLSRNSFINVTKATIGSTPKNVLISNVTTDSFTVSYRTDERVKGMLSYGTQPDGDQIAFDTRDTGKNTSERFIHYFTIKNIQPGTRYYFSIISGEQVRTENGAPYQVFTPTTIANVPADNGILKGKVSYPDGTLPSEGIITVDGENTQPFTALIQQDGSYTIPLAQLRTSDLQTFVQLTPESVLDLEILAGSLQSSARIAVKQITEIPPIILSKNYDFTLSPDDSTVQADTQNASDSASFPQDEPDVPATAPEIVSPKEKQEFKDNQPLFKGKALPNADIELIINSQQEITVKLQSDNNGNWEFRPPMALEPGNHTVTVASVDTAGLLQKITRSFTVYAEGSQFVEPSVIPVATRAVTPSLPPITPTPFVIPSPSASPSAIPSPTVTLEPTPILSQSPNQDNIQPTGSSLFLNSIIGAITALGIGTLLFIITTI